jgi:hypothetical protein
VRNAAGQLAEGFQPLRLLQRTLRYPSTLCLSVKCSGAPKRKRDNDDQGAGGRDPEDQVPADL